MAFELWHQMGESFPEAPPRCWDALIQACGACKSLSRGLELRMRMLERNVPFSTFAYIALLNACTMHEEIVAVQDIIFSDGVEMTVPMYISVLRLCGELAEKGDYRQTSTAMKILHDLRAKYGKALPRSVYNTVIAVCGRAKDVGLAFEVFEAGHPIAVRMLFLSQ